MTFEFTSITSFQVGDIYSQRAHGVRTDYWVFEKTEGPEYNCLVTVEHDSGLIAAHIVPVSMQTLAKLTKTGHQPVESSERLTNVS
jgi:hypothetical protein